MDYALLIRGIREDNDMSQSELAKILGTNQKVYSRYETGINEMPIHHLITICKYFNISADYLLGFKKPLPFPKR